MFEFKVFASRLCQFKKLECYQPVNFCHTQLSAKYCLVSKLIEEIGHQDIVAYSKGCLLLIHFNVIQYSAEKIIMPTNNNDYLKLRDVVVHAVTKKGEQLELRAGTSGVSV